MIKQRNFLTGFTLVELLVAIFVIGFLIAASMVVFKQTRMSSWDARRVANIDTIRKALAMYLNDSTAGGYPQTSAGIGECLSNNGANDVGKKLKDANVIVSVPLDPMWPTTPPSTVESGGGFAVSPSENFCYYYFSNTNNQYKLSYYLESNSKAGNAGINKISQ